jgi:hypothetical protein
MTQVVIDDVIPRTQLIATAGQTVFNTNWTADVSTDVDVYARAVSVPPNDITQIVDPSLYNVTFIGGSQTVRVTFLSGRVLNDVITIVRNTPAERLNLYINTNFVPSMLNQDFGILTLVDQQAQMYDTVINPGYYVSATIDPDSILGGGDKILPILPAQHIWRKNDANTAIETIPIPSGGFGPGDAFYWVSTSNVLLSNSVDMGALSSGLLKQTVSTGFATPSIALLDIDYYGPGMTGYLESPAGIKDENGNIMEVFLPMENAVNYIALLNATIGNQPGFNAMGADSSIGMGFATKADAPFKFYSQGETIVEYHTGTAYQRVSKFLFEDVSGDFTYTFPQASGTIALVGGGTVVDSIEGTEHQVLVNGTFGAPQIGDCVLTLPQDIDITSSPTFDALTVPTFYDANGLTAFTIQTVASQVNYISFYPQPSGSGPTIAALGSDTDINFNLLPKGLGTVQLLSANPTNPFIVTNGTNKQHITQFLFANTANTRNVTFQDSDGTVAWLTDIVSTAPTQQRFTSGSGTYTTPANVLYIRIRMVGGGGGGSGSGTATGAVAGAGGNTTFGSSLLTCGGGGGGIFGTTGGAGGGAGGSATLNSPAFGTALTGGSGTGNCFHTASTSNFGGAPGAVSPFGGAGGGGQNQVVGSSAVANSGSGGGGGGDGNANLNGVAGTGGGAGGFIDAIITSPSASYAYAIGASGTAGAAGTSGLAGGSGGSGYIEVTEYYK